MSVSIVGLGPSGLSRVDAVVRGVIDDADVVLLRTIHHPAASELAGIREVITCDDLYEEHSSFDDVYGAITERVLASGVNGSIVYCVPGSAVVGELTVSQIRYEALARGIDISVYPGLSFLDLAYVAVGIDPIADGLQVLDARDLSDPLPLHLPTIITQIDSKLRASDVALALMRTIDADSEVTILDRLGDQDEIVKTITVEDLARYEAGSRTTLYVPATSSGLLGLIATNRVLRSECPWDKRQTHHTLLTHLIEEAYETADAIGRLPHSTSESDIDYGAYGEVEEELGDLLLQVIFHATLASEAGAFDIDEAAESIRRKLVERHPHIFGDSKVEDADEVLRNWEQIKKVEKSRESLMDDIPTGMPAVAVAMKVQKRARSVGFDWDDASSVISVLRSEIDELVAAGTDMDAVAGELGDVLFTAINLSRHIGVDPETALRSTVSKFIGRFKEMEKIFESKSADIVDASHAELEEAWQSAKLVSG